MPNSSRISAQPAAANAFNNSTGIINLFNLFIRLNIAKKLWFCQVSFMPVLPVPVVI